MLKLYPWLKARVRRTQGGGSGGGGGGGGGQSTAILSNPVGTATGSTTADLSVSTTRPNGTLYWVVTTSSTSPTKAQVKLGQDHTSAAGADSGSQAVSSFGTQTISGGATGLVADTTYYVHFMHETPNGNQSNVATSASFTPPDITITTVFGEHTFTSSDTGWSGFTTINVIAAANLAANAGGAGTHARFTIEFTGFSNGATVACFWGEQQTGAGNESDYNGNQNAVTFSGNATLTGDGTTLTYVSDWCPLGETYDETMNHIFCAEYTGATVNLGRLISGSTGDSVGYIGGAVAGVTDKSGGSGHLTNTPILLKKVEIATGDPT